MKLAIVANPHKFEVRGVLEKTISWSKKNKTELYMAAELRSLFDHEVDEEVKLMSNDEASIAQADYVLVMGGDGTILYTARLCQQMSKPVLGINSGNLGFMANTQNDELEHALDCLLSKNFTLDKRPFLMATDASGKEYFALNEFLFTRKDSTSMINITAEYDGSLINTYWADGLIIASPTGSTAYNLSSGGPIVAPGTDVFLLTPINPHSLTTRPLVLDSSKSLTISIEKQGSEVIFSFDGKFVEIESLPFEVEISQSKNTFNLIKLPKHDYFETLRNKLMWGQDNRRNK